MVGAAENEIDELSVDDVLEAADETLLPGDPPAILTADMVLLPEVGYVPMLFFNQHVPGIKVSIEIH